MGLLPDSYFADRAKAQTQPTPPTPTAPVTPAPLPYNTPTAVVPTSQPQPPAHPETGPIVAAENAIVGGVDEITHSNIDFAEKGKKFAGGDGPMADIKQLSPEEQMAKYGGLVGSAEYYNHLSEHPYSSFAGRSLGEAFGAEFPKQETWDKMTAGEQAYFSASAVAAAGVKMVARLPRELAKAPVRLLYSIAKPWSDLLHGKTPSFDSAKNDELHIPWLGNVPTYWKTAKDARDAGLGPLGATLSTATTALGDVTISAGLAEGVKNAFQPKAKVTGQPVQNVAPVKEALIKEQSGMTKKILQAKNSPNEYYKLDKDVAKKFDGHPGNTFLKITPSSVAKDGVEVSVVQVRSGIIPKTFDYLTRKSNLTPGDFGPEIKLQSQRVPVGKDLFSPQEIPATTPPSDAPFESSPTVLNGEGGAAQTEVKAPITPEEAQKAMGSVIPKPLKGFEDKPIMGDQLSHLGQLAEANKMDPKIVESVQKIITGKDITGDLTQGEYVKLSKTLAGFNDLNKFSDVNEATNPFLSRYASPQRYWMRTYEEKSGVPLYSKVYTPMEDAFRMRDVFRDSYRNQAREIFGKYAESNFGEERRLVKAYMEGDENAISGNDKLTPEAKQELVDVATKIRPLYDKLGQTFGVETEDFLKNYQPHIRNIGGIYQLYKETDEIPSALKPFFEHQRKGGLSTQVDDALALFDIYTDAGSNKLFLNPALDQAGKVVETLPGNLKNSVNSYIGEKMGYAGPMEQYLNEIGSKIGNKLGANIPPDIMRQFIKFGMDTTYSGALGARPGAVVRNLLQYQLMTYPRLGTEFAAEAIKKVFSGGLKELRDKGFLVDQGRAYGQELVKDIGAPGRVYGKYQKFTQATLKPYSAADSFTRGATYWQGKLQWENGMGLYNEGKLNWSQLEDKLDFQGMSPVDRNIIRERLVSGDQEGAFNHYIRDVIDQTQFPYRRGAGARVTYGLAGKIGTQFSQWNTEFVHTLGSWVKTGQWDKLIRFYGAAALTQRTVKDTVGFDVSNWVGFKPLNPTLSPVLQFGGELRDLLAAHSNGNDQDFELAKNKIYRQLKSLAPVGVQTNNLKDFYRSIRLTGGDPFDPKSQRNPAIPEGQFGVFNDSGKLMYSTSFKNILWKMFGFPSADEQNIKQLQQDMQNEKFNMSLKKQEAMEYLQREDYDKATAIINEYKIKIGPNDMDAYHVPLIKRTFDSLPASSKQLFGSRISDYFAGKEGDQ